MKRLTGYAWPGNVRELQNVIERAAILSDGEELRIPPDVIGHSQPAAAPEVRVEPLFEGTPTLEELKKSYILHLLSTHGNMSRVARLLDVDRRSLYRMIERYHITRE
jgi:transcriptional regulator of acetoin/glycerol metabolism